MINSFLVLSVAGASLTSSNYDSNQEYLYRYEVITTSALRAANHQTSGIKIKTDVRLQINPQKVVTIKVIIYLLDDPFKP